METPATTAFRAIRFAPGSPIGYDGETNGAETNMSKSKGGGTGRGTGKKGWNRWQAAERRAKSKPKPYVSKGLQKKAEEAKAARQSEPSS